MDGEKLDQQLLEKCGLDIFKKIKQKSIIQKSKERSRKILELSKDLLNKKS